MNITGFLYGRDLHHLDHLAPFCHLFDLPLVVTDSAIARIAKTYYPTVVVHCYDVLVVAARLLKEFTAIVTCLPTPMIEEIFFFDEHFLRRKMLNIWLGHGYSDKGISSSFIQALHKEKILLFYGEDMHKSFVKCDSNHAHKQYLCIGNFRRSYYHQMQAFYDRIVARLFTQTLRQKQRTLLYAPTWGKDALHSTLLSVLPNLLAHLPAHENLVVKIHPNSKILYAEFYEALQEEYKQSPNVLFLDEFPLIYPVLHAIDVFLGDFSSINYDCLGMNKPMFFLTPQHQKKDGWFVHQCGTQVSVGKVAEIFSIIDETLPSDASRFKKKRKEIDQRIFGAVVDYSQAKNAFLTLVEDYLDHDIQFL